jgi:hypothetical protein
MERLRQQIVLERQDRLQRADEIRTAARDGRDWSSTDPIGSGRLRFWPSASVADGECFAVGRYADRVPVAVTTL